MEFFDSHAHLNDEQFIGELDNVFAKCEESGVKWVAVVGYNERTSREAVKISEEHENIYALVGAHPDECNNEIDISYIRKLVKSKKVVAIGEIGLDYHYDTTNKEMQKKYFVEQIKIANEFGLPVSIHTRDADMDTLEILKSNKIKNGFVIHCFSSSIEVLKEFLKLGAYISFAGTVTFKNAKKLIEAAKIVPLDKILVETDCPYLAPEPYRGRRNDPSMVIYTTQKIADLREMSIADFAKITVENAKKLYRI